MMRLVCRPQCHIIRGTFRYAEQVRNIIRYLSWSIWTKTFQFAKLRSKFAGRRGVNYVTLFMCIPFLKGATLELLTVVQSVIF